MSPNPSNLAFGEPRQHIAIMMSPTLFSSEFGIETQKKDDDKKRAKKLFEERDETEENRGASVASPQKSPVGGCNLLQRSHVARFHVLPSAKEDRGGEEEVLLLPSTTAATSPARHPAANMGVSVVIAAEESGVDQQVKICTSSHTTNIKISYPSPNEHLFVFSANIAKICSTSEFGITGTLS